MGCKKNLETTSLDYSQQLNPAMLALLPLDEAHNRVLKVALAVSGAQAGALHWVNRQNKVLEVLEVKGARRSSMLSTSDMALTDPCILTNVLKSKELIYIPDVGGDDWQDSDLSRIFDSCARSVLIVPILSHDSKVVVGVLHVISQRPHAFTEGQQVGLKAFAEHAQTVIQRVTWGSALRNLSQKALGVRSEALFPDVTEALANLLAVGVCSLWLVDPVTHDLVLKHATGRSMQGQDELPPRLPRDSFLGQALERELPTYSPNIQKEGNLAYRTYAQEQGLTSTLLVPIRPFRGAPSGLIAVYAVNEERSFTEQDRSLAIIFANHVAITLQHVALLADKERQVEIGESLQRVNHALATAKDFNGLLQPVVREAMTLVHAAGAILYIRDVLAQENVAKAVAGIAECVQGMRASFQGSLSGWVALNNQPALCDWGDSRIDQRIASKMGLHGANVAAVPLAWQENVIGTLVVLDKQEGKAAFDEADIRVLQTLATQATIALEKAQLYETMERHAKQQHVINDILTASVSSNDIDDILYQAARKIHEAFGYKVALVLIEQGDLVFKITISYDGNSRKNNPILKLGEGITGQAAHTRIPVVVPDVRTSLQYVRDHPDTRSEIVVPLLTREGQVIGVFDSESTEVNTFSEDDLQLFQPIAAGITLAIENVQRLKEHTTLRAIADVVSQAHDLPHILDNVVPTVVQLFHASACSLYLTDTQRQHLTLARHCGLPPGVVTRMRKLERGQAITGAAFEAGSPIVTRDLISDPRVAGLVMPEDGLRSMMSVPIKANTIILGVLNVVNATERSFTDHDVELLEIVSTQVGRAIEKAQLSEQYQRLYKDASDMMFTVDLDMRIIDANTQATEITGYPLATLLTMQLKDLMVEQDVVKKSHERMQDIRRGRKPPLLSFQIRSKSGALLWVESSVTPIRDHTKRYVAVEAIWRDITERRRTAAVVERRNGQLNTLLEFSRIAIATHSSEHNDLLSQVANGTLSLLDSQRCVVYLCKEAKNQVDVLAFPRSDSTPHPHTKPLCGKEHLIRNVISTQQGDIINNIPKQINPPRLPCTFGEDAQHVMLMPIKSSHSVFGVISVVRNAAEAPSYNPGDKEYLELLANILSLDLEHKRLAQIETKQQAALTTLHQVSMIGGFLAHKVPSVLGPIDWTAKALASMVPPSNSEIQLLMDGLLDSGRKATRLIAQCRSLGRPLYQASEIFPFAPLVQTILQQMTIPPSIRMPGEPLALPAVKANAALLAEVVEGVLQNALDTMPEGGELSISGYTDNDMTRLHIRDTGHGIAPEHLPHLFTTPFFTTKEQSSNGSRSGFSLWLSRLYLRSIGGDIDIAATSTAGTTFRITLPVAHMTPSQEHPHIVHKVYSPSAPTAAGTVQQPGGMNVLIVEDESNWQGRLSLPFIARGWNVYRASSYEEAIRLIAQHAFTAFVVDVRLVHYDAGNVDGLRIVEHLRMRGRTGPVLLLSVWETSLQQAEDRLQGWENIVICDKADDTRLDTELTALAAQHGVPRAAQA